MSPAPTGRSIGRPARLASRCGDLSAEWQTGPLADALPEIKIAGVRQALSRRHRAACSGTPQRHMEVNNP